MKNLICGLLLQNSDFIGYKVSNSQGECYMPHCISTGTQLAMRMAQGSIKFKEFDA